MPPLELTASQLLLSLLIVTLGTMVQATVGFGLALVAAPFLHLINPDLVPAPLLCTAWTLSAWVVWRERRFIEFGHFMPALFGRLCGAPPAALLMGLVSAAMFDLIFGILVLCAVIISMLHSRIDVSPRNLFVAAVASSFMGTISSIGGPPIALLYQHRKGATLRGNLALYFLVGSTISLCALHFVGRFGLQELLWGLWFQLGTLLGFILSRPLIYRLDRQSARPILLGLCTMAALLVTGQALMELLL